jgi:hypothetical protein
LLSNYWRLFFVQLCAFVSLCLCGSKSFVVQNLLWFKIFCGSKSFVVQIVFYFNAIFCFAALPAGNHDAKKAIKTAVVATIKKSVPISFTGK